MDMMSFIVVSCGLVLPRTVLTGLDLFLFFFLGVKNDYTKLRMSLFKAADRVVVCVSNAHKCSAWVPV